MHGTEPDGMWDDVIVGAGSAGSALAGRLSEDPDRRVLLLEAGPDCAVATQAAASPGTATLTGYNWDYTAHIGDIAERRASYLYPVGKVVGGSSAINGAIALRGFPSDFGTWAACGNPEWAWPQVAPYFAKIEADADFTGPGHRTDGPVPIRRIPTSEFSPTAQAFNAACRELGLPPLSDLNTEHDVGVGPVPSNVAGRHRVSAADAYLAPARSRPNLTLWDRCLVSTILFAGQRATGVEAIRDGRRIRVLAGRTTLCAGGINTPAILQRSGLGDQALLRKLGIPVVANLPGVGRNLIEHAVATVWMIASPGACTTSEPLHQVMSRLACTAETPDVGLFLASGVSDVSLPVIKDLLRGRTAIAISAMLLSPESRGAVVVRDAAPTSKPVIALRLATAAADVERLMRGTRFMWSVARSPSFTPLIQSILVWNDRLITDEHKLRTVVKQVAAPMWHPAGTARMGPSTDSRAVVDQHCRVHLVRGLRVVDASIMPTIPRAPTNLTCMLLGERAAEWMR
jgi:choline dehydrogenase